LNIRSDELEFFANDHAKWRYNVHKRLIGRDGKEYYKKGGS